MDRLIKIIHRYCPKLIIATKYKPNVSMQTAQLRALIQYMLMVKRAKKRLQWAEGWIKAVEILQCHYLNQNGPASTRKNRGGQAQDGVVRS